MSFVLTLSSIAIAAVVWFFCSLRRKNRLSSITWEQLIGQLEAVPLAGITEVAVGYLQPAEGQIAMRYDELWQLVGGAEGLRRMQTNAKILIQLAAFAEQWDQRECVLVGERMRHEALIVRRAVNKIQRGLIWHYGRSTGPFIVQEATSSYYLLRKRLLTLYETSHKGRHARLSIALGDVMASYGPAF